LRGWEINFLEYDSTGVLAKLDASFAQARESITSPPLYGHLRYNMA
jgi:hypothetical protein